MDRSVRGEKSPLFFLPFFPPRHRLRASEYADRFRESALLVWNDGFPFIVTNGCFSEGNSAFGLWLSVTEAKRSPPGLGEPGPAVFEKTKLATVFFLFFFFFRGDALAAETEEVRWRGGRWRQLRGRGRTDGWTEGQRRAVVFFLPGVAVARGGTVGSFSARVI